MARRTASKLARAKTGWLRRNSARYPAACGGELHFENFIGLAKSKKLLKVHWEYVHFAKIEYIIYVSQVFGDFKCVESLELSKV
jgi:hypothetical protein